jgi:hypothetical protein
MPYIGWRISRRWRNCLLLGEFVVTSPDRWPGVLWLTATRLRDNLRSSSSSIRIRFGPAPYLAGLSFHAYLAFARK